MGYDLQGNISMHAETPEQEAARVARLEENYKKLQIEDVVESPMSLRERAQKAWDEIEGPKEQAKEAKLRESLQEYMQLCYDLKIGEPVMGVDAHNRVCAFWIEEGIKFSTSYSYNAIKPDFYIYIHEKNRLSININKSPNVTEEYFKKLKMLELQKAINEINEIENRKEPDPTPPSFGDRLEDVIRDMIEDGINNWDFG